MAVTALTFGPAGCTPVAQEQIVLRHEKNVHWWLDLAAPTDQELDWLQQMFDFHPLTIEDCRQFNQRAKVEEYETYLFITMAIPRPSADGREMEADELHAYLGSDYLVTVHTDSLAVITAVRQRLLNDKGALKVAPDFLLYMVTDQLMDQYFPMLEKIEEQIDAVEDEVLDRPTRATLNRIFALKQGLIYLRKTAGPEREVFNALAARRFPIISARTGLYFRDIYDHLVRTYEIIETSRDLLGNALDAYLSVVSNRLNEVMKRLTLVATIFMPLSFLAGFGGINFQSMPFGSAAAFAIFLAVLASAPLLMMIWFWRKEWV